ncbi:MAG: hypothetical protein D6734_03265, partial [Candidatus Schekmanbacteria bacterium]
SSALLLTLTALSPCVILTYIYKPATYFQKMFIFIVESLVFLVLYLITIKKSTFLSDEEKNKISNMISSLWGSILEKAKVKQ